MPHRYADNTAGCFIPASGGSLAPNDAGMMEYWMGCLDSEDPDCEANEKPHHMVRLDPFQIQLAEVTNGEYVEFLNDVGIGEDAEGCGPASDQKCHATKDGDTDIHISYNSGTSEWEVDPGNKFYSVYEVSWYGAYSFCDLGAGDVPWAEVVAALREIGYDRTVVVEMMPWDPSLLRRTSAALDVILGG